jgi:hypothetical protein
LVRKLNSNFCEEEVRGLNPSEVPVAYYYMNKEIKTKNKKTRTAGFSDSLDFRVGILKTIIKILLHFSEGKSVFLYTLTSQKAAFVPPTTREKEDLT